MRQHGVRRDLRESSSDVYELRKESMNDQVSSIAVLRNYHKYSPWFDIQPISLKIVEYAYEIHYKMGDISQ